jgi:nucleoside-diphosphate-sugar epimerase
LAVGGNPMSGQRVLVTGHRGYIGSVLAPSLVRAGHEVVGLDTGYFDACTLIGDEIAVPTMSCDLRDVSAAHMSGIDAVVHLAALSNDPIGNLEPRWTRQINVEASVRLAQLARAAGVRRFVFSSSCIMYGMSEANVVDEMTPLNPRTEYARSKADAERAIAQLADERFAPTMLRNGTVYGLSPRMRLDTVFNSLIASAVAIGKVVVHGDGRPWRPVVHVQDVADAFRATLEAPPETVAGEIFNVGADHLNYRIIELARIVTDAMQGTELDVRDEPGVDQRTYRATFGKWAAAFPDFKWRWTPTDGAFELRDRLIRHPLTAALADSERWVRLRWLRRLLAEGRLDDDLRWTDVLAAP